MNVMFNRKLLMLASPVAYFALEGYEKGVGSGREVPEPERKKPGMSDKEKNLAIFQAALIGSAAHSDGILHSEQEELLKTYIDGICSTYSGVSDELLLKIRSLLSRTVPFSELRDILGAVDKSANGFLELRNKVSDVVKANSRVVDAERAFIFKCELLFEGMPDVHIFKYKIHISESDIDTEYMSCLSSEDVRSRFPETDVTALKDGVLYTVHPSSASELVPFEYLLSDSFAASKHSELINAAREAGASRIRIEVASSQSGKCQSGKKAGLDMEVKVHEDAGTDSARYSAGVSGNRMIDDFHSLDEGKVIEYEFEGNRPSGWFNFKGQSADQIISQSRWLKEDDNLVTLVKGFFGKNRLVSHSFETDYSAVGKGMKLGGIAAKCDFPMVKASLSHDCEERREEMMKRNLRYYVDFRKR
jgi:hypothetical protein